VYDGTGPYTASVSRVGVRLKEASYDNRLWALPALEEVAQIILETLVVTLLGSRERSGLAGGRSINVVAVLA